MSGEKGKEKSHFSTIVLSQLPDGRRSKHTQIVSRILDELWKLDGQNALRVDRESFGSEKLSNVRAAVSRAVKKHGLDVSTATDDGYFYIWFNSRKPDGGPANGRSASKADGRIAGNADARPARTMRPQADDTTSFRSDRASKHFQSPQDTDRGNKR